MSRIGGWISGGFSLDLRFFGTDFGWVDSMCVYTIRYMFPLSFLLFPFPSCFLAFLFLVPCVVVVYSWTEPRTTIQRFRSKSFAEHVEKIIESLPVRCIPVLLGDLTGKLGLDNQDTVHILKFSRNWYVQSTGPKFQGIFVTWCL